ncbi:hypothetical protein CI238_12577 [Colletotrichum incanum]|uniref:Uncharacterized protein n=1 Tax=Colletotrichum incanum TaxID=1573173 RepID=A0A167BLV2_COLIC|nr:hypothetical protein CI238_12577 [Colletotrichum incanum]
MHLPTLIAALAPASLISAYTAIHSKQYCEQSPRTVVTLYNANLGSCYNTDGAAAYQFTEVAAGYSWVCDVYSQSNCKGVAAAYSSYNSNTNCNNSPIGWVYSFKCYLK